TAPRSSKRRRVAWFGGWTPRWIGGGSGGKQGTRLHRVHLSWHFLRLRLSFSFALCLAVDGSTTGQQKSKNQFKLHGHWFH
ncbi:MAG TPA: hypothetical protein VKA81_01115, partial [Verrucomicrobiae bacterium]|nr:hypothetical protein [Verrucomicrobiae bacterium]